MNKDQVEGKAKDITGRIERQAGEWTGDSDMQVKGTAKQAEGKAQNVVGKVKDAINKNASSNEKAEQRREEREKDETAA